MRGPVRVRAHILKDKLAQCSSATLIEKFVHNFLLEKSSVLIFTSVSAA